MAKRKTRRARRNTGRLPWVKVMVRGLVGPGFMDSGWDTGPFFVYAPEKTDQAAVLNAVRKAIYYTEIEKWSPVSFERVASVPDRMFPHTTVGLDGEYIPRTGAKKNPRSLSMTSDGFQRTPTLSQASGSTQSPQDRTIFDAGVSQVTGGRPTFSQLEEGNLFTQGSSQGGNLEPSWEPSLLPQEQDWERPTPEFEQIEQSQTPTDTTSWRQGYTRGGSYMRSSSASQPGSPTPDAKMMRQLIDPQLWRLADGGDRQAMYELERRGPSHYRPARPNPSEKCPSCKGSGYAGPLGDTCERCEGSGWLSVETCGSCRKKVRGGTVETSQGDWVCGSCYDQEQGISRDRFGYRIRRNPPNPYLMKLEDAIKGKGKGGKKARKHKRGHKKLARRNTTASPAARGFTFMHADDNNQWAEWALSRQGIQHRGTGYGPGSWPVAARQNPGKVAKKIKTFSKGQALWHVSPPTDMSSARPGYGGFLKAGTTSWPAWKASTGWNHAKVAIQFMTRGFGVRGDYPKYIRRLARFLPPSNPTFSEIWATYTRNRTKIAAKAGRPMPTLAELKRRG
jgi:hypothetical protein